MVGSLLAGIWLCGAIACWLPLAATAIMGASQLSPVMKQPDRR